MNHKELQLLIEEGEGFELEFKRKITSPEKIARTLSAFANTKGGTILFGVDDNGFIIGVESEKTELDLITHSGEYYCVPPVQLAVEIIPFHEKDVIAVFVEESNQKPHAVKSDNEDEEKIYIRVNANTVLASKEVIKVLRDENKETPLILSIGENEKRLFEYLEKNEKIIVTEYAKLINVSQRRASRILTTLVRSGVIRIHTLEKTDYFTLASDEKVS